MSTLSNPRHERLAQELAIGKSATEAMQIAGYKSDRRNSTRLTTNKDIRARVAELQGKAAIRTEVTIEKLTEMLLEDRRFAMQVGQAGPAVSATERLGKLHGFFVDRTENVHITYDVSPEPLTDDEWAKEYATAH